MIDKTETAFQGLVNLAGANIATGSITSNDRRLKDAKRKRSTGTASSTTFITQLPHSHSASIMIPRFLQTPNVILMGRGIPAPAREQII
jgi:hypothetical protein